MKGNTFSEIIANLFGGMDKVAHFGIGWAITSACTTLFVLQNTVIPVGLIMLAPFVGTLIVAFLAWAKEFFIDPEFEWKDIIVSVLGACGNHLVWLLAAFFNWLTLNHLDILSVIPWPFVACLLLVFAGWWFNWSGKSLKHNWMKIVGKVCYILSIVALVGGIILIFI